MSVLAFAFGALGPSCGGALESAPPDTSETTTHESTSSSESETSPESKTILAVTDGSCGSGSHDGILADPALATCIVNFVESAGASVD